MSDEEAKYTESEVRQYGEEVVRQYAQEKSNTHTFFTKVIQNDDTIKTGNVTADELGSPQITIRGLKELELFCDNVLDDKSWADYFKSMAEIQTSSSLSKEGFLLKLSVTNKKELADVTPQRKKNSGWFRRKESNDE